jgi:hypothetical protein
MTRDDIIRLAREAGFAGWLAETPFVTASFERFAALIAAAERKKVIKWIINKGYDTGHVTVEDEIEDFLNELEWQITWRERGACAEACEEKMIYQMQIPCPDGIPGCLVFHAIEAKREKTGSECAYAIRARGKT